MTHPFLFYKEAHAAGDPTYRAPQDAVASWRDLAEQVRAELARIGLPVTVLSAEASESKPVGAHVLVHETQPFGVTVDWHTPVENSESFVQKIANQDLDGLVGYVGNANRIITRLLFDVLKEAHFRVLIDYQERDKYLYRVLEPPRFPMV
ncbi:hypothetical protein [Saccharothrix coeruleofusca]|uniref:Uncharacterized protein n=1 Tax=Saccharothrix coeruleofusca TaxID=33919 RepID=A0A918ED40_9PSEU|nr:hypothetical protein [Saccharothrix coeruleofusca]GGP41322.1 hypothetical protein GCM10010185_10580 [Saccharothrix coeruleofusca]